MELETTRGLISSGENDKERTYYLSTPFHRHPPLEEYSGTLMPLSKRLKREGAVNFRLTVLRGVDSFASNIHNFDRPLQRYFAGRSRVIE